MNKPYYPLFKLILFFGIIACSSQSRAQVSVSDSLTLVSLYNGAGGTFWGNHTNWLTTTNVSSWYGIKVANNRVVQINLPSNNLTGAVTDSLYKLDSLNKIDFSRNGLTYFPVLAGLHLDSLSLQNNKLTFKDLVPNKVHVDSFFYAPQDSGDVYIDTTVTEQSSISLVAAIDNNPPVGDNYHWYMDTTSIVSGGSNTYTILCMDSSKVGTYFCKITNQQLTSLTLYRRAIALHVRGLADPGASFSVCSANSTLQGVLPAGASVLWTVAGGNASITNNTAAITAIRNLSVGDNVFKYSVSANNISCPANTYSIAFITVTRDTNPSPASAGVDQSVCSSQVILAADAPSIGIGTWTVTKGNGVVAQPNSPSSAVNGLSSGENIFRWQITNGACAPSFFDEVKVFRDDSVTGISAGADVSICATSYTLNATLPDNTSGIWSVVSGAGDFGDNSSSPTATVTGLNQFSNILRWTVSNTCNTVSADINVSVYGFLTANAGPDKEVYFSPINTYTIADSIAVGTGGTGIYAYTWSPSSNLDNANIEHPKFLTPDSGSYTYTVTVTDSHGCTASDDVNYHVVISTVLDVPTLITPNGDGVNDALYIPGIESYPNNELTVVDRNDQIVFKQKGYKNDWQGTNVQGFSQVGLTLPADTYFYTLKLEDSKALQKGFFLIKY